MDGIPHVGCWYEECKICFPNGLDDYPRSWMTKDQVKRWLSTKPNQTSYPLARRTVAPGTTPDTSAHTGPKTRLPDRTSPTVTEDPPSTPGSNIDSGYGYATITDSVAVSRQTAE